MDQFKVYFLEMVKLALQNPPTEGQQLVVGIVALLSGAFVFLKICDKFDIPNVGMVTGFLYSVLGGAVMLAAMVAGKIYLPELQKSLGPETFLAVMALGAAVALYVPLLNHFIHGKYMGTLAAWVIAVATFLAVVALVNVGFDMGRSGQRALNRGSEHNENTKAMTR
jgi:uncharacterized membrane-anchored protein